MVEYLLLNWAFPRLVTSFRCRVEFLLHDANTVCSEGKLQNLTSKETKQRNRKVTGTPDQASLGTRSRQKNKLKVADISKAPDNKKQTLT